MRKCWLPAFSPFSTLFSKDIFSCIVKIQDCLVKGKHSYSLLTFNKKDNFTLIKSKLGAADEDKLKMTNFMKPDSEKLVEPT